ncbi:reverse transcriptase RNA-dependent DNA polymerase [Nitzschia inconspicua]|uniref:Reverse transcriptase RNA-dependent DNA polymerase n=1 Tax=Nitzschia inconspicua TaxID=303405 RepID=A0A9K3M4X5_9STRA|nr:reverse transcriptase RNA-dependent DNA polymerase [Nitzschia inconspicua]
MSERKPASVTFAPTTVSSAAAAPAPAASTANGAGNNGNGGSSRHRGRNRHRGNHVPSSSTSNSSNSSASSYKGDIPGMNGHVFQVYSESSDPKQFSATCNALQQYVEINMAHSGDMALLFSEFKNPTLPRPRKKPTDGLDADELEVELAVWNNKIKKFGERCDTLEDNLRATYNAIWGQCSVAMRNKLKSLPDFKTKDYERDCAWILNSIKGIAQRFEGTRVVNLAIADAVASLYNFRQGANVSVPDFYQEFCTKIEVVEHFTKDQPIGTTVAHLEHSGDDKAAARDRDLAILLLRAANQRIYGSLVNDLENLYSRGEDQYPANLAAAYNMLLTYRPSVVTQAVHASNAAMTPAQGLGLTFTQTGTDLAPIPGLDGILKETVLCFKCQRKGHIARHCPSPNGIQLLQCERHFVLTSTGRGGLIPENWILIDSESTLSMFKSRHLLTNIRHARKPIRVCGTGGDIVSYWIGDLHGLGTVWLDDRSLANIISLAHLASVCRVTMDSAVEKAFRVYRNDGSILLFREYKNGLYYHDYTDPSFVEPAPSPALPASSSPALTLDTPACSLLQTVRENKTRFTRREVDAADRARDLYVKLHRPGQDQFEDLLAHNRIRNCPITVDDARRAITIYGPEVPSLQGKTTKGPSSHVPSIVLVDIPLILKDHPRVTLAMDLFFVQGNKFFHTISRDIRFRTVAPIEDRSKRSILRETLGVTDMYANRGFTVTDIHTDNEFECLRADVAPIVLNVTAADDHVGEVERSIRTIKERVRAAVNGMPYRRLPNLMIRELVRGVVTALNIFPARDGVSADMSPRTIVSGLPNPDYTQMKLEFGSYVQVYDDPRPTNRTNPRTIGAIALNHTGNAQGDYHFMSLVTGSRISRAQYTPLPITDEVIAAVEGIAAGQGHPVIGPDGLLFEWRPNHLIDLPADFQNDIQAVDVDPAFDDPPVLIDDGAPEPDLFPAADPDAPLPAVQDDFLAFDNAAQIPAEVPGADMDQDDVLFQGADMDTLDDPAEDQGANQGANLDELDDPAEDQGANHEADAEENDRADVTNPTEDQGANRHIGGPADHLPPGGPAYDLRPNRTRNYAHRFGHDIQLLQYVSTALEAKATCDHIVGYMMTQMTATAGIKKHGQAAVDALFRKFAQLDDKTVFEVLDSSTLTREQRRAALRAVNLIKEKRDGSIKGRSCADGRPQKALYSKEATTSPTISIDALLVSLMINAKEQRDVAMADVEGAFLHAWMDDFVLMKITGQSVDIMCSVNPAYAKFVVVENGVKTLYVRLLKALYGCVKSALLWYNLFASTLMDMGFELNPYDPCVANKMINGKQCTVAWYVDDNKISHVEPQVVTDVIAAIEGHFGKMTVTRGRHHKFLGMDITFNPNGTVSILMEDYLKGVIEFFGEPILSSVSSAASKGLLDVNPDSPVVAPKERIDLYGSIVPKLLHVALRARPDILPAVAFLCTRLSDPREQDWNKLRRLLQYINGTISLPRILGGGTLTRLKTWVDASYAVHPDFKSHTGGAVSLGLGAFMCKSQKQKLNTKSSTEAELVGASDYLPSTIWVKMFMEAQGYPITVNDFAQDNESAMKLELNGRASAGQKSRHINIRHFFITDRVKTEGLNIVHCPTEEMLADFFTKPLQGTLFRKFRDVILGHKPLSSLSVPVTSLREERVGRDIETQTLLRTGTLLENAEKHSEADLMENAKKHSEAASRAGKSSILEAPSRRTYADVLRGCEGPKVTDNGITGRDKGNVSRGCKSIADGVVCANKIGRDGVVSRHSRSASAATLVISRSASAATLVIGQFASAAALALDWSTLAAVLVIGRFCLGSTTGRYAHGLQILPVQPSPYPVTSPTGPPFGLTPATRPFPLSFPDR